MAMRDIFFGFCSQKLKLEPINKASERGEIMELAEKIIDRRKELNMSRYRLAKDSEIPDNHLYMIEKGERKNLRMDTLRKLAKGLQMPFEELAEYVE